MKTQSNYNTIAKQRIGTDLNEKYRQLAKEIKLTTIQANRLVDKTKK